MEKSVCERDRKDRRVDDEAKKRETEKIKSILIAFLNKSPAFIVFLNFGFLMGKGIIELTVNRMGKNTSVPTRLFWKSTCWNTEKSR